jgi:hypothetical protein
MLMILSYWLLWRSGILIKVWLINFRCHCFSGCTKNIQDFFVSHASHFIYLVVDKIYDENKEQQSFGFCLTNIEQELSVAFFGREIGCISNFLRDSAFNSEPNKAKNIINAP